MLVVWKLDRELALVFWLGVLICVVGFAEREASVLTRGRADVTDRTDYRAGPDRCLAREELLPVTTHTSIMIGKVGNVGKISSRSPRGRNLMTFFALKTFMFFG
jgi:hypothetical protein